LKEAFMTQITLQHPQSIVVATDFSPPTNLAVEQAARLAKCWESTLHILHAGKPDDEGALRLAQGRLEKQQESLSGNPGIQAKVELSNLALSTWTVDLEAQFHESVESIAFLTNRAHDVQKTQSQKEPMPPF
jgi:nucleotide-binding universal stress UspA family protein